MTSVPVRRRHLPMTAFRETAVTRTTVVKTTAVTMTIAKKTREDGHVGGVGVLPLRKRGAGPGRDAVLVSEGARCCAVSAEGGVRIDFLGWTWSGRADGVNLECVAGYGAMKMVLSCCPRVTEANENIGKATMVDSPSTSSR